MKVTLQCSLYYLNMPIQDSMANHQVEGHNAADLVRMDCRRHWTAHWKFVAMPGSTLRKDELKRFDQLSTMPLPQKDKAGKTIVVAISPTTKKCLTNGAPRPMAMINTYCGYLQTTYDGYLKPCAQDQGGKEGPLKAIFAHHGHFKP